MGFSIPAALSEELDGFKVFLNKHLKPNLSTWYKKGEVSLNFYNEMGKAVGAFELALDRAQKRDIFGQRIIDFQAKAFEFADFFARIEAARLMLWKACAAMDENSNFRQESSLAKYLTVQIAREVTPWAADVFGAVSVVFDHPIHKYPMDA